MALWNFKSRFLWGFKIFDLTTMLLLTLESDTIIPKDETCLDKKGGWKVK